MSYQLLTGSSYNLTQGLQVLFIYCNDVTGGLFSKMMLLALWCIICFGIFFSAKRATGTGDFPPAFMIASFVVFIFAMIMRLVPGLVDIFTIAIIIVMNLIGIFMLMWHDDQTY